MTEANRFRFRAWSTTYKCFMAEVTVFEDGSFTAYRRVESGKLQNQLSDECVLMQSTGLADKNGGEVFEGDLLGCGLYLDGVTPKPNQLVRWVETGYNSYFDFGTAPKLCLAEVIGNIHQHPHLLEAE
jgi:hypothetical protein